MRLGSVGYLSYHLSAFVSFLSNLFHLAYCYLLYPLMENTFHPFLYVNFFTQYQTACPFWLNKWTLLSSAYFLRFSKKMGKVPATASVVLRRNTMFYLIYIFSAFFIFTSLKLLLCHNNLIFSIQIRIYCLIILAVIMITTGTKPI